MKNDNKSKKKRRSSSWIYEGEDYKQRVKSSTIRRSDFIIVAMFIVFIIGLLIWYNVK